jgi:dipeptide/tripeptide permease
VCGLTAELYRPAASALLTDVVPPASRLTAFAAYRLAVNAGYAAGPALAGYLAERSFFLLFAGDALTSVIYGLLVVALLRAPGAVPAAPANGQGTALSTILSRDPGFAQYLVACVLAAFVVFQHLSSFPLWVEQGGHDARTYGHLIAVNGLLVCLIELPLTQVLRSFRPARVIAAGFALTGLGFALTGLARSQAALLATVVVWTMGEITWAPMSAAYVANLAPAEMRGRYMGAYGLTWSLGLILAPAVGLRLFGRNPALLWALCGLLSAIAVGLVLRLEGRRTSLPQDKDYI